MFPAQRQTFKCPSLPQVGCDTTSSDPTLLQSVSVDGSRLYLSSPMPATSAGLLVPYATPSSHTLLLLPESTKTWTYLATVDSRLPSSPNHLGTSPRLAKRV